MVALQNDKIKVKIKKEGAEVVSLVKDREYLWCGDDRYWDRISPILFPIVGRLKENRYTYEGKPYSMGLHGFANCSHFTITEKTDTKATFMLTETEETLKIYPFTFTLLVTYEIKGATLITTFKVKNTNEKPMYFSIGGHPGFCLPENYKENIEDYYIKLYHEKKSEMFDIRTKNNFLIYKKGDIKSEYINLQHDLFKLDALIHSNIDKVILGNEKTGEKITMCCEGFPYLGIWSRYNEKTKTIAPFICLEPWHGIADFEGHNGDISTKEGIVALKQKETFCTSYTIEV